MFGYSATGLTTEQILVFLYGTGANGKTTLLDAIGHAMGDYFAKDDRELLAHSEGGTHPTNIADLMGKRVVVCSETNAGRRFDEAKLKDLVGETVLKARKMRQDFYQFRATHKLFLYSNHRMVVRGQDHGFWRRMREVPFIETIGDGTDGKPNERDPKLPARLQEEAAGVLAWIVAGAAKWYAEGLGCPPEVTNATNSYRSEMDAIGAFIDESCVTGDGLEATARELYAAYTKWAEDSGERPLSQTRFGTELGNRGMVSGRDSYTGRKTWSGIGLRAGFSGAEGVV